MAPFRNAVSFINSYKGNTWWGQNHSTDAILTCQINHHFYIGFFLVQIRWNSSNRFLPPTPYTSPSLSKLQISNTSSTKGQIHKLLLMVMPFFFFPFPNCLTTCQKYCLQISPVSWVVKQSLRISGLYWGTKYKFRKIPDEKCQKMCLENILAISKSKNSFTWVQIQHSNWHVQSALVSERPSISISFPELQTFRLFTIFLNSITCLQVYKLSSLNKDFFFCVIYLGFTLLLWWCTSCNIVFDKTYQDAIVFQNRILLLYFEKILQVKIL